MKRTIWLAGSCGLAFCIAMPVQAQVAETEEPAEASEQNSNVIVVTATRREQSLQEVPVAVTAITGEVLDNTGVSSVEALTSVAPSITFTQSSNDQNNSINIRGVGTSVFSQGVESSVSVVVDDVVMARQAMGFQDLADIQRVEVLRGPQSTLFGKNASAGVISVTTQEPTDYFSGSVDGQIAEGGEYTIRGTLSGPLGGDFSGRLTGYFKQFDGHIENVADGRDLNGYENWGLRGKILFEPDPDFRFTLIGDYRESRQDCCIYVARDTSGAIGPAANGRLDGLLAPVVASQENAQSNVNAPVFNDSDQWGVSGKAELDLGGGYSLTSISAYRGYDFENNLDVDLLPLEEPQPGIITFDLNSGTTKISQMSQEIRLTSPQGPPLDFVLGGFAFFLDLDRTFQRRFEIAVPIGGGNIFRLNQSGRFSSAVTTTNLALFGSANIYLTDQTVVFGGARLINETLEYRIDRDPANVLEPGDRPFGGGTGVAAQVFDETEDTAFTGEIGLRHEFTPDVNAYARYARGYKGRAIDVGFGAPPNVEPIEAETSDAFEVGLKSIFGDLTLNLALFQTDFENFQEQAAVLVEDPNNLLTAETRLTNVGSVRTRGIELEALYSPSEYTFIQGGVSYTDASIREFDNASCFFGQTEAQGCVPVTLDDGGTPGDLSDDIVANLQDLAGSDLPNAPEWRLTGVIRQKIPVGASFAPFIQLSGRWQSGVNYSLVGDPRTVQGDHAVINVAAGIEAEDGSYSVSVFVNNVFDQFYATNIFGDPLFGGVLSQYVPRDFERFVGARARFSF